MKKRFVYADNAATTKPRKEAIEEMMPYLTENWGNPSSIHSKGEAARAALSEYRERIARVLGCDADEIVFTSCGTEADNHAIRGVAYANATKGKHIVTTKVEHPAVLNTCRALEKEGFRVTYLDIDGEGRVSPEKVNAAICEDTILVSVMYANNEIGTVMPVREIADACHARGVIFMTDAVQAVGTLPVSLRETHADLVTVSGHKIGAPKGIGLLYIKKGTKIKSFIEGGGQERARRGGTENLPYIAAFAKALELAYEQARDNSRIIKMRDRLINELLKVPRSRLNGSRTERLPGNVNMSFEYVEGESLLLWLDMNGISASTGSACSSNSLEASHVLLSIGVPIEQAHGSLRFSLSASNTEEEVDAIIASVREIVEKLRAMSPIYPGN